ncbi:coniferyl aldehyde dehydrogenase [Pseudomarimonas salicorniae]|uniref:Aldehyde dehydrogenase n=1 Tax=Pseudomarimonas salicorniae TaxID=2933270 RepID=A0ABT0GG91_9GAMM|nr:coniferyl aldehyde dehydrogenase [Lysobacter sp. CAU 1642]MCK7593553.1 coniferyl aldehyde dehydrogenase [Lysobacter sp. CAU 1642]
MDRLADTPPSELAPTLSRLRAAQAARVPDYHQRRDDLRRLRAAFKARLPQMVEAMQADFGQRSRHESLLSDGFTVLQEIDDLLAHLRAWMRPQRRRTSWLFWPGRSEVRIQPLGVVGVISPWNYPVNLALMPLATAIAAGNHVYLKPSEHTPATSAFMRELLAEVFPEDRVAVALGGPEVASAFAGLPFDHLFFTGSTAVGRKVMAAAAPNLTPVTLELGGKSPAIIGESFPLATAAARIASGKWLNAGQTCIAPDYLLVAEGQIEAWVEALRAEVRSRYPDLGSSADYTRIVNAGQYQRLRGYLDDARERGLKVIELAEVDPARAAAERIVPPTLVIEPGDEAKVMQDEIFGPILPLKTYRSLDEAIAYINAHDRPLALYHFEHDRERVRRVLERTVSGGVTVNDCLMHIAQEGLPFGGVGPSGMGHYHGREGFMTFSKQKAVFYQSRMSSMALFKPPYRGLADFLVRFLSR